MAAYRDPDLSRTVESLFQQAASPGRLTVAVLVQVMGEGDAAAQPQEASVFGIPEELQRRLGSQLVTRVVDARDAQGPCWARRRVHGLRGDEQFALQIDSHMR